jgi:redox-sensitive bicupin YhaK (pirin superfamily)
MEECALYVVDGEVTAGARSFGARSLLVRAPGATLSARTKAASRLVIVGGTPVDGPRYLDWNFVSSSRARLEQAKAAWRAQTFPKIPGDDREFIPLPALG